MKGRDFTSDKYRYGFNGKEKDDEVKGKGNSYDFGARLLDTRLGRWLSIDPLFRNYPDFSPYGYCYNSPLRWVDKNGEDIIPSEAFKSNQKVQAFYQTVEKTKVFKQLAKYNEGVLAITHLRLEVKSTIPGAKQQTVFPGSNGYPKFNGAIEVNTSVSDRQSDVLNAANFIHELIHNKLQQQVVMINKIVEKGGDWTKAYPGIADFYKRFGNDDSYMNNRSWQHNMVASFYRNTIIEGIKEFDAMNGVATRAGKINIDGVEANYTTEQFYEALSWDGLKGTVAWNKLSEQDKKLYSVILTEQGVDIFDGGVLPEVIIGDDEPADNGKGNKQNEPKEINKKEPK